MALAFLTLNGVGLGHLVRTTTACRLLESVGERPVVFAQGIFPLDDRTDLPGRRVPPLWKADDATRVRIGADVRSFLDISVPAVLVEDTHPNPVRLPRRMRRVLLVRPTTFDYLSRLRREYDAVYSAFLLCDAPGSPTWPYTRAETDAIAAWRKWALVGPIYRGPDPADLEEVRARYRVRPDERLVVFTMGGGGQHRPTDRDVPDFLAFAARVADRLRAEGSEARLIFVRGPYFPDTASIDPRFEEVGWEPRLPALLALADGVVTRAGFNTLWECISAGTPFIPFVGTTFDEPARERLARLRDAGLLVDDLSAFWADPAAMERFRARCAAAVERWRGAPDAELLRQLVVAPGSAPRPRLPVAPRRAGGLSALRRRFFPWATRAWYGRTFPLLVRVDDVVSIDSTVDWLLRLLAARGLRASLEVIPYLADFDERRLEAYDPGGELFEVSQHGWAHLPRSREDGRRYEFDALAEAPTRDELRDLRRGKAILERAFPTRFTRGFSPPFDALPRWLPAAWTEVGGAYVSALSMKELGETPIPVLYTGDDVWDWRNDRARDLPAVVGAAHRQAAAIGHAGIALHPRCLRSRVERARLSTLLDLLLDHGFFAASLGAVAQSWEKGGPPGRARAAVSFAFRPTP